MGSLEDFELRIKDMIHQFKLNVSISGVAYVVTEAREKLFSASLIVNDGGVVPVPNEKDVHRVKSVMQQSPVCGYTLHYVHYVCALFKDEKLLRWQTQYAVSVTN